MKRLSKRYAPAPKTEKPFRPESDTIFMYLHGISALHCYLVSINGLHDLIAFVEFRYCNHIIPGLKCDLFTPMTQATGKF